jgi:hypothetical protein
MRMFHGSSSQTLELHQGLCLTDDEDSARDYAFAAFATHMLHTADVELAGLVVIDAPGDWDRDENTAASDNGDDYGADVIVYDDETPMNRRHVTYRLLTPAALAAVTVVASSDAEDC